MTAVLTPWSAERVETLKALRTQGLSSSQIAKALGGTTRRAVIGKAYRLGLDRMDNPVKSPKPPSRPRPTAPKAPTPKSRFKAPPVARAPYQNAGLHFGPRPEAKKLKPEPVEIPPTAKPWEERGPRECAFPVNRGGETLWSCCAPGEPKQVYCKACRSRMFYAKQPSPKALLRLARIA